MKVKLIELKQVSHTVGCYLSEDVQDVVGAVKFVQSNNKAIEVLAKSDIKLLVYLLELSEAAHDTFSEILYENEKKLNSMRHAPARSGGLQRGLSSESPNFRFRELRAAQNALGGQEDIIANILAEDSGQD